MDLVDCHCHLEAPQFDSSLEGVLGRSSEKGVAAVVSALAYPERLDRLLAISHRCDFVHAALGVGPYAAGNWREALERVKPRLQGRKCVAIGEIGLDHHHSQVPGEWALQEEAFTAQLELAERVGLPVVVHSRKAEDRVFELLEGFPAVKVLLHCFLVPRLAAEAERKGYFVSLPSVKSSGVEKIVDRCSRVVCETDSPFLSPDGGVNEPWKVAAAYESVARCRKQGLEEAAAGVNAVVERLYGIGV